MQYPLTLCSCVGRFLAKSEKSRVQEQSPVIRYVEPATSNRSFGDRSALAPVPMVALKLLIGS